MKRYLFNMPCLPLPLNLIYYLLPLLALLMVGCTSIPDGLQPVKNFDAARYLGTWYEIARLDHSFERGLTQVSASYTQRADGGIDVLNRGFDPVKNTWRDAQGRAYFLQGPHIASLKVTFFWPFYGGYHVIALDPDYRYALIAGPSREYLWILARDKRLPPAVQAELIHTARQAGFNVDALILVKQD